MSRRRRPAAILLLMLFFVGCAAAEEFAPRGLPQEGAENHATDQETGSFGVLRTSPGKASDEEEISRRQRGVLQNVGPILGLILALQVKALLALPLFLLAAGLIGLKSLAVGLISAAFSGASLLRTLLAGAGGGGGGSTGRPAGGASSRVAYEVRGAPPQAGAVTPLSFGANDPSSPFYYPPTAYARQPDVRIISAAANN